MRGEAWAKQKQTTMEHWRKNLDPNWIGTYILPDGQTIEAIIVGVRFVKGLKVAGKTKDGYVADFATNKFFDKPMLLNPTNLKRLTLLTGSPMYESWVNIPIYLTQEMSKMPDGTQDYALRIGFSKPVVKAVDYSLQTSMLRECQTIDDLQTVYKSFTKDQQTGTVNVKDEMKILLTNK